MKLFIKYMVSLRCKMVVKAVLEKMGLHYENIELGEVVIKEELNEKELEQLKAQLFTSRLELMEDKKAIIIQKIKNLIIEMIHYEEEVPKVKNSEYISAKLHYDYTYLANLFSEATGTTIEHFIILHKVEKVKELIIYNELNLTEIAWKLHYSSVAHLSNQFKKITGVSPSFYKLLKEKKRKTIEDI